MYLKLTRKRLPKIKRRPIVSHKYDYGNVFIFGGSIGYLGAPLLSARASYRSGAGLVHLVVPSDLYNHVPKHIDELMVHPYRTLDELKPLLHNMDAALFGPGLNPYDDLNIQVLKLLLELGKPIIVDASGLVTLKQLLGEIIDGCNIVITPHAGEASQLLETDRPHDHLSMLTHKKITVVLKDHEVHITSRHLGYVASAGNPGMATAGSGDVLSGIILAKLGQHLTPLDACKLGVYLHQKAGAYAKEKYGEESMIASDIIECLPDAFKSL